MNRESADILGGRLNIAQKDSKSSVGFTVQLFLLLAVSLASLLVWIRFQPAWAKYQDRRYRKQKRRQYGIPDDDNRPFEVAHAAAIARRKPTRLERVRHDADAQPIGAMRYAGSQSFTQEQIPQSSANGYAQPTEGPSTRRPVKRGNGGYAYATSSSQANYNSPIYPPSRSPQDYYGPNSHGNVTSPIRPSGFTYANGNHSPDPDDVFDDDRQLYTDEVVDNEGDVTEEYNDSEMALDDPSDVVYHDEPMDEDMEEADDIVELGGAPRGKKRDRVEAGSTFGGDDSGYENDPVEEPRRTRQRPRRSYKQQTHVPRGQKRNRDRSDEGDGDSPDASPRKANRRKREKSSSQESSLRSDTGSISQHPQTRGRRIGEEWEANGIKYKVGPNGERLREALVTKPRPLFPMPVDSQHPDREKQVGVLFRDWLTEEQYQLAKERQELGHQVSRRQTSEPETPSTGTPIKGKDLHYSTPISGTIDGKAIRVKATIDLRATPGSAPSLRSRRISSIGTSHSITPSLSSPTIGNGKNEQSSWEKKHQEDVAMSRLTRKYQMLSQPPNTPSITITPPPASGSGQPSTQTNSSFTFGPPAASSGTPTSVTTGEPGKASSVTFPSTNGTTPLSDTKVPASGSTISFGTKPVTATSAPSPAAAPAAPSTTFAFGKPAANPVPAAIIPASTSSSVSVPNFFGQKASTTAAAPTPAPSAGFSILGAASNTGANTPSSTAAPTPQPEPGKPTFSFGAQPKPTATPSQHEAPKSLFGFGPSSGAAAPSPFGAAQQQKPAEQPSTTSGGSLLSRLGGFSNDAPKPAEATNAVAAPSTSGSQSAFSFGTPSTTSSTAAAPSTSAPAAQSSSTPASGSGTLKFNFGITKPSATTSSTTPTSTSTEAPKTTPSMFGFGAQPAGSTVPAASNSQPTSAFGAPSQSNTSASSTPVFGGSAFGSTAANTTEKKDESKGTAPSAPKFSFGFAPSGPGSSSSTGTGSSPFGATANTAAKKDAPAPAKFTFGASSSMPSSSNTTPTTGSAFSGFGNTAASNSSSNPNPFGAPPATTSTSAFGTPSTSGGASSTNASGSAFGNTTGSSSSNVFGKSAFGSNTSGATPSASAFGFSAPSSSSTTQAAPSNTTQKEGEQKKPTFTFNLGGNTSSNTSSPFGAPKTTSAFGTPAFGAPSSTTTGNGNNSAPTPAAFGFGTPNPSNSSNSSFSFGSSSATTESSQK